MSDFCVYLRLPRYVGQWCRYHFGDPVCFPSRSYPHFVLRTLLRPRPRLSQPQLPEDGLTSVQIPDGHQRHATTYNYLSHDARQRLESAITEMFQAEMYRQLLPLVTRPRLNLSIEEWCHANGIEEDSWEAVRQSFYRMRVLQGGPIRRSKGLHGSKKSKKRKKIP